MASFTTTVTAYRRTTARRAEWYEKAADNGDATAIYALGTFYENGYGVAQDPAKARELYQKAADMGDADAIAALEKLPSREAAAAGRYAEAMQLQEALGACLLNPRRDGI